MSIRKDIWKLAWPVMMVSTLHTLFGIVDLLFISWLGTSQNAGAGISASILSVIFVMPVLISSGTTAIVARAVGADNEQEFLDASKQSIVYAGLFGITVFAAAQLLKNTLIGIFGVTPEVFMHAKSYIDIIFISIPINFITVVLVAILHAKGDTKTPMWFLGISNLINIVLDWVFIMLLGYGISGAAMATVVGEVFAVIALSIKVLKLLRLNLPQFIRGMHVSRSMLYRTIRIGGYAVLYGITRPFTGMLMYKAAAEKGMAAIAAFNTGGRLFSILFIFLGGLEVAISIMVGQGLGSKDVDRIDKLIKEGIKVALICLVILAIPYVVFSRYMTMIFLPDPEVLAIGARYLRIVYVGLIFLVFLTVFNAVLKGAGDTKPSMLGALVGNWLVKIPLAYVLSRTTLGTDGIWIAIAASVFAETMVVWYYFRKGNWRSREV